MNSSDIIEDSIEENCNINDNSSMLDFSSENFKKLRPSLDVEVDESFTNNINTTHDPQDCYNTNEKANLKQTDFISSDEDADIQPIMKSAKKTRIRIIASDSEDEFKHAESPAQNSSFTNHRSPKPLDSDEEDDEESVTSFNETSDTSNLKDIVNKSNSFNSSNEIVDELSPSIPDSVSLSQDEFKYAESPAQNRSFTSHRSPKPLDSDEEDDKDSVTSLRETPDMFNLKDIVNNSNSFNSSNEIVDELSPSIHDSVSLQDDKSANQKNKDKIYENISSEDDVISIPSEDDKEGSIPVEKLKPKTAKLQQTTIDALVREMSLTESKDVDNSESNMMYCSAAEYANQSSKVANLRTDVIRCKTVLRNAHLPSLPDKGALLKERQRKLEEQLVIEEEKLKNMFVNHEAPQKSQKATWEQLQTNSAYVVPNTVGKQAMNTFAVQKTLTMDRLKNLHDSLATCPDENTLAEDPKGLKVELMRHQKRALAWLMWREGQKPAGGILADDMGLGKTLTMISLILATKEADLKDNESDSESEEKESKWTGKSIKNPEGGTLVICPATLIKQWECEIDTKLKRNLLSAELYHGTKRETRASRLAKYDVVITTYKLAQGEYEKNGPLFNIKWKRVILDEAHVIRNPKSQTSVSTCALKTRARWALTGTPVHNKELDLYALLKYLRCSPFDDIGVWKRWVANKNAGGQDRLNTVITSILLRRTKAQLQTQGSLNSLPEKIFEIIEVALDKTEKQVYEKILVFSRTLFIEFLRRRAEKNPEFTNVKGGDLTQTNDEEYNKMHKKVMQMHGNKDVKSHEILVLLLRLRQICCHPSLISSMLDREDCAAEGIEDDGVDIDMLDKLNNLNLDDENEHPTAAGSENFSAAANKVLSSSNPIFASDRANGKLRVIQKIIEEKVIPNGDKIIIVSQWTSMLHVIMCHLKTAKIKCDILDGKVPVHKRNDIVVGFNDPRSKIKVLLLSLTAGGVGLNLVGANHLLLVDLHWNPQLESQAQDRIYRMGQKKTVYVYKIVTLETIEEKIKALQDSKLSLASDLLSGVRPGTGSKLSLDDLKMLFNIAG